MLRKKRFALGGLLTLALALSGCGQATRETEGARSRTASATVKKTALSKVPDTRPTPFHLPVDESDPRPLMVFVDYRANNKGVDGMYVPLTPGEAVGKTNADAEEARVKLCDLAARMATDDTGREGDKDSSWAKPEERLKHIREAVETGQALTRDVHEFANTFNEYADALKACDVRNRLAGDHFRDEAAKAEVPAIKERHERIGRFYDLRAQSWRTMRKNLAKFAIPPDAEKKCEAFELNMYSLRNFMDESKKDRYLSTSEGVLSLVGLDEYLATQAEVRSLLSEVVRTLLKHLKDESPNASGTAPAGAKR